MCLEPEASGEEWNGTNDSSSALQSLDFSPTPCLTDTLPPSLGGAHYHPGHTSGEQAWPTPTHTDPSNHPAPVSPHKAFNNSPTPSISFHLMVSQPPKADIHPLPVIVAAPPTHRSIQTTACLKYTLLTPPFHYSNPPHNIVGFCKSLSPGSHNITLTFPRIGLECPHTIK